MKKLSGILVALVVCFGSTDAFAVTITAPADYSKFLSVITTGTVHHFGYWTSMKKYAISDRSPSSTPHNVPVNETFVDPSFAAFNIDQVFAMGTTKTGTTSFNVLGTATKGLNNGVVELYDNNGQKLLSASLIPSQSVFNRVGSSAGISGLYNVTGGIWFTNGLVGSTIFADYSFSGASYNGKDLHAKGNGVFNFYRPAGTACVGVSCGGTTGGGTTGTQVPEPATVTLLATSLVGGFLRRRNKK